ncbi:MAG TPA: FtsX-like permease family protein [Steroidobacteraceae bacterium]|jgi:putative ABC transport system permease protein|nr:FtsX-like permease family protein [Steroidobacteraceae bacterium]
MRFLPLIWSGIWRKPGRTILIFLQVSVAFALFGMLQGLKTGVEHLIAEARADLLIVHSRVGFFAASLPLGMLEQIKSLPGVNVVNPVELFGGIYQKTTQQVGIVAVRPDEDWTSAFTFVIAPEYLDAFRKNRTGALARAELARKYGWKVGDHVPLKTNVAQLSGSKDWTFEIVGTFTDKDIGGGNDNILINFAYLDEARLLGKGTVQHFNVAVSDPKLAMTVADEIDRRFANSPNETRSESLREMAQSNLQAIGDLNFLIRAIVGAVLVALLFATATMMMQSIRERTPELAVLKTVGFTNRRVFALVLIEAVVVCVAAAALGLALATLVFPFAARIVHGLSMPWVIVAVGLAYAVLVALISAAVPAMQAARLKVATALAKH